MSQLDDYVAGAVSTESTIDEVKENKQFLQQILIMHIATGKVLEQFKNNAFYNREYSLDGLDKNLTNLVDALAVIAPIPTMEVVDNEEVLDINPRIFHSILGASTESVELLEALNFDGDMDLVNIGEEFGDLNWYQAIFCDAAGIKWDDILDTNAEKLFKSNKARYKEGFSDDDDNERNLKDERNGLEALKIKSS